MHEAVLFHDFRFVEFRIGISIAIGVLMTLDIMDVIHGSLWDYLVLVALIALGVDFVFGRSRESD